MSSDNDIIRRPDPATLSVAERHFSELCKGTFDVTLTQDGAEVTREKLKEYRAVIFFTAINPPGVDKAALLEWVKAGGAFVGIHSTANTYQDYPAFGEMLGAYYERRPWRTAHAPRIKARIKVNDPTHMATRHLPASFEVNEDIYQFKKFDPAKVQLLLSLDPASLDMERANVNRADKHLPISWVRPYGQGRVFYTALGDGEETWKDPLFRQHLIQAICWTMRLEPSEPGKQ